MRAICMIGVVCLVSVPSAMAATTYTAELVNMMADWSVPIDNTDALNGKVGTVEAGGFHWAFPVEANPPALTDGVPGVAVASVLQDFAPGALSLQIKYEQAEGWVPSALKEVRTFCANEGGRDGRVRQNVDVEWKDAGGVWSPLITEAITGSYYSSNHGQWGASLIRVKDDSGGMLLGGQVIHGLRFKFWLVDNTGDWFLPRWEPALNTASIIKEMDAVVPEPAGLLLLGLGGLLLRRRTA